MLKKQHLNIRMPLFSSMEINKTILISVYVVVGLYILYRLLFKKNPYQDEYERLYNEILSSKKYKVKGQYDKEE